MDNFIRILDLQPCMRFGPTGISHQKRTAEALFLVRDWKLFYRYVWANHGSTNQSVNYVVTMMSFFAQDVVLVIIPPPLP